MEITIEPLPGCDEFGALVRGLDRSSLGNDGVRKDLYDLWIDRGVIVFRDTDGTAETQIALSKVFGELEEHPLVEAHVDGFSELVHVRYRPEDGDIYEVNGVARGGYLPWHSDLIYVDKINRGGILRPISMPEEHGETGFLDQINAYSTLPDNLKEKIENLYVVYWQDFDHNNKKFGQKVNTVRLSSIAKRIMARVSDSPRVIHPMVFEQPETGRKVLNVSPGFAQGIYGMENEEGDQLLSQVILHCEDPTHAYVHEWQYRDMVLWDNWRMLHCAFGVESSRSRHMQRTTIRGDYRLGRVENPGKEIEDDLRVSV